MPEHNPPPHDPHASDDSAGTEFSSANPASMDDPQRRAARLAAALEARTREVADLQRAAEAKNRFLAGLSHEIRTPLSAIVSAAALAQAEPGDAAETARRLRIIRQAGDALLDLVDQVLDFSRMEIQNPPLRRDPFDLHALLAGVAELMDAHARRKGLLLTLKRHPAVPQWVLGDGVRLRQVLFNMIGNAIKFTPRGEITLQAEPAPPSTRYMGAAGLVGVRFAVCDTGVGVPPAQQALIFKDFKQISSQDNTFAGGVGLGLAIASRLVEAMGGRILVASEVGRGSVFSFTLTLPRTRKPPAGAATPEAPAPFVEQRDALVLVVDDNPLNLELAAKALQLMGLQALRASTVEEALTLLREHDVRVVIADIQMPGEDGLDLLRQIRNGESAASPHTPVVALTAHAMPGDKEQFLQAGFDRYLPKPLDLRALREVVSAFLDVATSPDSETEAPPEDVAAASTFMESAVPREASASSFTPPDEADPRPAEAVREALEKLGGRAALLRHLERAYAAHVRAALDDMAQALQRDDREALRRQAHAFKGSAATVGDVNGAAHAQALEQAAAHAPTETVETLLRSLEQEVRRVAASLMRFSGEPKS